MSGHKRSSVTIADQDYQRLHDADMERIFKAIDRLEAQSSDLGLSADLQAQLNQLKERQEGFCGLAEYFQEQTYQLELELEQELTAGRAEFYDQIYGMYGQIWGNYDQLNEILSTVSEHSRQETQKLARRQKKFGQQLHQFVQEQEDKRNLAYAWYNSALALDDFIRRNYDHEHFFPGLVEKITDKIEMARYNLDNNLIEAAVNTSQDTYLQLSGLRQSLEQKTLEFESLFTMIHRAAENLSTSMGANANCPALDLEGKPIDYSINLNHWSSGRFEKLHKRLNAWIKNLSDKKNTIPYTQLQEIFVIELPRFQQDFESIIYDARLAAINSQLRANIAEIAIIALQNQGYINHKVNFESNDQRGNLVVNLENFDGSRVNIQVNAIDDKIIKNDLVFEAVDFQDKTEHELRLQYEEIRSSLARFGLQVGPMESNQSETPRRQRPENAHLLAVPQKIS